MRLRRSEIFGYFHSRYQPQRRVRRGLIDAAPLVDVALLVLLFFVVNASFVVQPGVRLNLPAADFDAGAPYDSVVVTVAQEGMIFFNDERTTLEGLPAVFAQATYEDPEAQLIIEADERVQHGTLVEIYNMALETGIRKVTLATRLSPTARAR